MTEMIQLNPEQNDIKAKVGDRFCYTFYEHVSVGYWADFEIEDEKVVKHTGSETAYDTPERMQEPGISGADSARTSFFFEAVATGTTLLIVRNIFRGDIESEYRFRITVS